MRGKLCHLYQLLSWACGTLGLLQFQVFLAMGGGLFPIFLVNNETIKKRIGKSLTWSEFSKTQKIVTLITHFLIMPFTIVYSFLLPLKLGTIWFYVGLPICLMALVVGIMAGVAFATAPLHEPINEEVLVFFP